MALIGSQVNDILQFKKIKSNYFPDSGVCFCSPLAPAPLLFVRFEQLQVTRGRGGL